MLGSVHCAAEHYFNQLQGLQLARDGVERRADIGAHRSQHSHDRNRDQSGNEAVLDRRRTIVILQELGQSRKHTGVLQKR